ncbi:MAG TPA: saccharopine dehydrogenase NADP-binding domain-containing protein [Pseudomonadales bacterium]
MASEAVKEFDVVVFGASGFTGRLVAEYLLERYGMGGSLRWAIAGRNREKLEAVRRDLGPGAEALPVLVADSDDRASLEALAARTAVVATTVGPYALYGSKLVAVCAERGVHYCDLTGEVHWMRRMIDAHHETARGSGARIVHTCGFDSVPSDLGVHWLQREMHAQHGVYCAAIKYRVESTRGSFSGGTVASMLNMLTEAEQDPTIETLLRDPYALNPEGAPRGLDGPEKTYPDYDPDFSGWVAPFVMAEINTKVVRRSNALLGTPYGVSFRYDEGMLMPYGQLGFPLAVAMAGGTASFNAALRVTMLRRWLTGLLPEPGEGPDRAARESGHFQIQLLGKHPERSSLDLRLRLRADRDPGYGATSRMLGESAVCLAKDPLISSGGVLTPSVAMGDALIDRLHESDAMRFLPLEPKRTSAQPDAA